MRILVVCQYYYPENIVITDICEALVRRGHEVEVVTGLPNYGMSDIMPGYKDVRYEEINGVKVNRVKLKPRKSGTVNLIKNYLSFWKNSKKFLRHFKKDFDVVYSMSLSPLISVVGANIYAKKHKVRHVIHVLDLWPESPVAVHAVKRGSLFYKTLYKWSKKIYERTDEILVSTPSFVDYFHDVLKIDDKKIEFLPLPASSIKPSMDIKFSSEYNLVYAGNIGSIQMVDRYIKAISTLGNEYDFKLHIIGGGVQKEESEKLVHELGMDDKVKFYGILPKDEADAYSAAATAVIVSMHSSGSPVSSTIPNKLINSMALGKPIIYSLSGDGKRILEETNGGIYAGFKEEEIAEGIKKMFKLDPKEAEAMGKRNGEYFKEHFVLDSIISQLENELSGK